MRRDLRLVAAKAMLENDRRSFASVNAGQARAVADEFDAGSCAHQDLFEKADTPGASVSLKPCVTSGPSKPACLRQAMKWGKSMTPVPAAVKPPAAFAVLGVRHSDAACERVGGAGDDAAPLTIGSGLEQIGRVEHDAQAGRTYFIQEPLCRVRRIDHIGQLRLNAEVNVMRLGERHAPFPISVMRSRQASAL